MTTAIDAPATLLTPEEAANTLRVKVQTLAVWRTTRRHALPFVRVGRSVRYTRESIERFVREQTVAGTGN